YVKSVSERSITYTNEFRRIFISEYEKGKFPRKIFEEYGFVISILGVGRVESISKRWRAAYKKNGIHGLDDSRKGKSGKIIDKEFSIEEKYERLKAQNNLLNRNFKQNIPGKVLLTDITYLFYKDRSKKAYLSTIKDASTNEILAYNVSESLTLDIVIDTLTNLKKSERVKIHNEAFIHSDQGAHYTSPKFQKLVKDCGLG
ncbi:DDE-type integrase/transposase/recombinase, partial [Clostridium perfringens]